jgi:hypothetical protein
MEGKRITSCAANSFWMAKSILLNTIYRDLENTTLICMTLWTLFKILTASGVKKPKVSKENSMKVCWLLETLSQVLPLTGSNFEGGLSYSKISSRQSHKWGNFSKVHTSIFSSYYKKTMHYWVPKVLKSVNNDAIIEGQNPSEKA